MNRTEKLWLLAAGLGYTICVVLLVMQIQFKR